jgi:hypothetical protein
MKKSFVLFVVGIAAAFVVGESYSAEKFKGPPHGGTPVQIGSHGFHLELVRDAEKSRFQAFVLDGHVEGYVKVPEKSFEMMATIGDQKQRLTFNRVPDSASGNPAEPSYTFEGSADWIKHATNFNAVFSSITLKGKTFTNVTFSFPKGSMHRGH